MNKTTQNLLMFTSLCLANSARSQLVSPDTALMVELVTTTASQLNELEKLVSNAEKYTEKMQKYNELFQDEYFKAERVLYIAESLAAKKEIANLGDLNWAIRELKYSMSELQELMREYAEIKSDETKTREEVRIQKKLNEHNVKIAKQQVEKSIDAKTTGRATQLTAQNTAMIYESNVEMHNTQLEILKRVSTTNRLLAEQMEEKRLEEIQKQKSYNIDEKKK